MMSLFTLSIAKWYIDIVRRNKKFITSVVIETKKIPYVI